MCSSSNELSAVLARLSAHLDKMAGQVHDIEAELGNILLADRSERHISISKIQLLHFIRQSIEDCALLTHYLSTSRDFSEQRAEAVAEMRAKLKLPVRKTCFSHATQIGTTPSVKVMEALICCDRNIQRAIHGMRPAPSTSVWPCFDMRHHTG